MKSSPYAPIKTADVKDGSTLLDRIQKYLKEALDKMAAAAVDNEVIVRARIAAADTVVYHGLGQAVTSWEIVDRDANAVVWRTQAANASSITLRASAPVNVAIRFT